MRLSICVVNMHASVYIHGLVHIWFYTYMDLHESVIVHPTRICTHWVHRMLHLVYVWKACRPSIAAHILQIIDQGSKVCIIDWVGYIWCMIGYCRSSACRQFIIHGLECMFGKLLIICKSVGFTWITYRCKRSVHVVFPYICFCFATHYACTSTIMTQKDFESPSPSRIRKTPSSPPPTRRYRVRPDMPPKKKRLVTADEVFRFVCSNIPQAMIECAHERGYMFPYKVNVDKPNSRDKCALREMATLCSLHMMEEPTAPFTEAIVTSALTKFQGRIDKSISSKVCIKIQANNYCRYFSDIRATKKRKHHWTTLRTMVEDVMRRNSRTWWYIVVAVCIFKGSR